MIGWYVHHHGWGHLTRMQAIRPHLDDEVTVFSSLSAPPDLGDDTTWIRLPGDADPVPTADGALCAAHELGDVTAGGALHWAPIGHPGHQRRLATIADWIARHPVAAFVVDVSVEVTAFVRLLGVPTVVFAQPGDRSDRPHRLGHALADRIVAPWTEGLFEADELSDHHERVRHVGAISRHDGRTRRPADDAARRALFLSRTLDASRLAETIDLLTARGWVVDTAGARDDDRVDDVWPLLCRANVVISAAGLNGVADLATAGARAVVLPQDRPFGEQEHTARVLQAAGLASTAPAGSSPAKVVELVERAAATVPADWSRWGATGAAARAAHAIQEVTS